MIDKSDRLETPGSTRFELLSRKNCHLCVEMEQVLAEVMPALGQDFIVRDVDSREEWQERFGEVVPVLLRNGRPVAKIRIDRRSLERLIGRHRDPASSVRR